MVADEVDFKYSYGDHDGTFAEEEQLMYSQTNGQSRGHRWE